MYCGQDWDPIDPNEMDVFSIDFKNDIFPNEGISNVISWSIGITYGTDPTPSARLIGNPGLAGTVTSIVLTTAQPGVTYWLSALVQTTSGRRIELWSHVPCVVPM